MSYQGERSLPLQLTAASQLLRNRAVTITSGVPAYATYGEKALGVTRCKGDANDYVVDVMPLDNTDTTFFLRLAGTVTAHALLFPTGTVGAVVASSGTVKSRSVGTELASATDTYTYIVPTENTMEGTWTSALGTLLENDIAKYVTNAWTEVAKTTGMVYFCEDEGCYIQWNGTAWVRAYPCCKAGEAGVSGDEIACYVDKSVMPIESYQMLDGFLQNARIVCSGLSAAETDSNASVVILDERIASTDYAIAVVAAATTGVSVIKAACTADTLTVTLSGNGGAGTRISYVVLRPTANA